ncbi:MAG: hypothetical protein H5U40_03035 [Polyangiaceae bacterium]|nr:hypothetical protein [Polyangiaceae bacterium]
MHRSKICAARWLFLFATLGAFAGCGVPIEGPDGIDLDPGAIIEGSVLYAGPRPFCLYDSEGVPTAVPGVLLLTLVDDARPLPPEGTNAEPASLLAIAGANLFSTRDCRPRDPAAFDPNEVLTRSASFSWPQIALARSSGKTISYRVTGFYDQRGDFSPFFTALSSPTKGDIAGAALVDPMASPQQYDLVVVGNIVDSPLGERHEGVNVVLGGYFRTEPPMFYILDGDLNAALPVPDATQPHTMQNALEASSAFTLRMFGRDLDAGNADDRELESVLGLLHPSGDPAAPRLIDPDLADVAAYAWYHDELDLDRNGVPDLHPVLGPIRQPTTTPAEYFRLESPVVLLERIRTPEELRGGIPRVGIQAASPNRGHGLFPDRPVVEYPDARVIVPPIAALVLSSANAACQLPYMPPGTPLQYFEARPDNPVPVECHEIPTGTYTTNVLHGVVGGTVVTGVAESETGTDIEGGAFSNQVWAVPNALGDPAQLGPLPPEPPAGESPAVASSQGVGRAVRFVDPTPDGVRGRQEDPAACFAPSLDPGIPARIPNFSSYVDDGACDAGEPALEDLCCAEVRHLCFLPLCPNDACEPGIVSSPREGMGELRRFSYTSSCGETVEARRYFPECIPFHMPTVCCEDIWAKSPRPAQIAQPFPAECP